MSSAISEETLLSRLSALEAHVVSQSRRISYLEREVKFLRYWDPITDFPSFGQLPQEVRDMIWYFALPSSRLIEVNIMEPVNYGQCETKSNFVIGRVQEHDSRWDNRYNMNEGSNQLRNFPALLSVCRDSRRIAMKAYDVCFSVEPIDDVVYQEPSPSEKVIEHRQIRAPGVRFQPAFDTIFISSRLNTHGPLDFTSDLSPPGFSLGCVRSIAIYQWEILDPKVWEPCFQSTLIGMNNSAGNDVGNSHRLDFNDSRERSGLPWFEGLEELILLVDTWRWDSPDPEMDVIKAQMEQKLRGESTLTTKPKVKVMSVDELRYLPRFRVY